MGHGICVARIGLHFRPLRMGEEFVPARFACLHVVEADHVREVRHSGTDERLPEEHGVEPHAAEEGNLSPCVEHLDLSLPLLGAVALVDAKLKNAGFTITFDSPTFNEFVVEFPSGFEATYKRLLEKKIVAGLSLAPYYPELSSHYLLCVTETRSKDDMDALVGEVK